MKLLIFVTLVLGVLLPVETNAYHIIDKGIYGVDNRLLAADLERENKSAEAELALSIFAQIPKWRITKEDKDSISIETKSLQNALKFCPDEKFSELPIISSCTAFLVAPDLILTAGHCVKNKYECQKNYWVLDYNDRSGFSGALGTATFSKEKVFSCAQIISSSEDTKLDYALIRLTRNVTDRSPLKLRQTGKIADNESMAVIGHPLGIPKIYTDKISIRNNSLTFTFLTDADTFSGNSGSPVINSKSHLVEGILVRGDEDFRMDLDFGCNRVFQCAGRECRGETVQRITSLPLKLIPKI